MDKKEKKNLPFEEDVDIEFEYKVFLILDKISRYKYFIIGFIAILIAGTVVFFVYKQNQEEVYNQASKLVYQIKKAYEADDMKKVKELIHSFKTQYSDTPFLKVVEAYEVNMYENKDIKKADKVASDIRKKLFTDQLKSGYKEFKGYVYYQEKNNEKALSILGSIDSRYYNNISAKLLTAIILKKEGKTQNAQAIFQELSQKKMFPYFSSIANENL